MSFPEENRSFTDSSPVITIVMPVYNGRRKSPNYLTEAIDSVINQSFSEFELIIVDDGSDEDYNDLVQKYSNDQRITWKRTENGGQSAARNLGAKLGNGKWLAFIDQDDRWYPHRLEQTVSVMNQASTRGKPCSLVYGELDRIDAKGRIIHHNFLQTGHHGTHHRVRLEDIIGENAFILPGTMLINRHLFLKIGGFNRKLSGYEDDELSIRLFNEGKIIFIEEPLIQWRIYPESYSYTARMDESRSLFFAILCDLYPNDIQQDKWWVRDIIAPRFQREWAASLRRAIKIANKYQARKAKDGLRQVLPHLSKRKKFYTMLLLALPSTITGVSLDILRKFKGTSGHIKKT